MFRKSYLFVMLAVLVLLGGITVAVLAETSGPSSSEYGIGLVESLPANQPEATGIQPDEEGYQGGVQLNEGYMDHPSEEGLNPENEIDWDLLLQGQPDQDDSTIEGTREGETRWSNFHYVFAAGSTMRPRSSGTGWSYPAAGCVSTVGGNDIFTIHLQLPQGSRIDYLRIFYYDTSANNSRAWVTNYNAQGGFDDLTMVDSDGIAGYGTNLSGYLGHIVNNADTSYVLNYRANHTGATMRLCGLRVAYRLPD